MSQQLERRLHHLEAQRRHALATQGSSFEVTPELLERAAAELVAWHEAMGCPCDADERARMEQRLREMAGEHIEVGPAFYTP